MRNTPWIILLCKFSDDPRTATLRPIADYAAFFGSDHPESIPSYWRDVSYGELDLVTGTEISPWLHLPQKRSDHAGLKLEKTCSGWAKTAGRDAGIDFDRFFGVVAFFAVQTDLFGTSDNPHVVCDLLSSPAQILQEYGHAYGLKHSRSVSNPADYENPFCIMSGLRFGADDEIFRGVDPTFASKWGPSGPGLCSPYVLQSGWLPEARSLTVKSNGTYPSSTILDLAPLGEADSPHPQMAMVEFDKPQAVRYCIEYRHGGWDRGIFYDPIVIHQLRQDRISVLRRNHSPPQSRSEWTYNPSFTLSVRRQMVRRSTIRFIRRNDRCKCRWAQRHHSDRSRSRCWHTQCSLDRLFQVGFDGRILNRQSSVNAGGSFGA